MFNQTEDFEYYKTLKDYTEAYKWSQQWYGFIEHLRVRKNASTLVRIFIEEMDFEQMPDVLAELGTREWFHFEQLLADRCPHILNIFHWHWKISSISNG